MTEYEYKTSNYTTEINDAAQGGWRLVNASNGVCYWERPIATIPDQWWRSNSDHLTDEDKAAGLDGK